MSISSALSNAISGMTAAARSAEVISSNVSNASTDGYGRRVLETSSQQAGGHSSGVRVDGISRQMDVRLVSDRRLSDAETGQFSTKASFFSSIENLIGLPSDASSLSAELAAFETSLIDASSRPDSDARLETVRRTAQSVQDKFNTLSDGVQSERQQADQQIATQVALLNDRLAKVADLNSQIIRLQANGTSTAALLDHRHAVIDEISEIVPLRQYERENGSVALYTTNGAALVDGTSAELTFQRAGLIVPEMSLASGALSGLEINGQPVAVSGPYSPIAGGSLAGLFQVRDADAPALQAELDALARDLIERFQDPSTDPTLLAGSPGLFTDQGGFWDASNETGLAARLSLNAVVDPDQGGAVRFIRDGLAAVVPGDVGDSSQINRLLSAFTTPRTAVSGQFTGRAQSMTALAGDFLSHYGGLNAASQADLSFAQAKNTTLVTSELAQGVDTDAELQNLLLVEQSYAANARVIQVVDDMMNSLLGI